MADLGKFERLHLGAGGPWHTPSFVPRSPALHRRSWPPVVETRPFRAAPAARAMTPVSRGIAGPHGDRRPCRARSTTLCSAVVAARHALLPTCAPTASLARRHAAALPRLAAPTRLPRYASAEPGVEPGASSGMPVPLRAGPSTAPRADAQPARSSFLLALVSHRVFSPCRAMVATIGRELGWRIHSASSRRACGPISPSTAPRHMPAARARSRYFPRHSSSSPSPCRVPRHRR